MKGGCQEKPLFLIRSSGIIVGHLAQSEEEEEEIDGAW